MIERIKKHIDEIFENSPKTRANYELKEEILANSYERYYDLLEESIPEEEAYQIVINSIGDIEQLFEEETSTVIGSVTNKEMARKRKALVRTAAIGMYIAGFIIAVIFTELSPSSSGGFIAMLVIYGFATCLLIYEAMAYPKYEKVEDTVVEEFKEWNHNKNKRKTILGSISIIIWMCTLVLYFIISFATMAWYITWIIFLMGVCAQAIVTLVFQLKDKPE